MLNIILLKQQITVLKHMNKDQKMKTIKCGFCNHIYKKAYWAINVRICPKCRAKCSIQPGYNVTIEAIKMCGGKPCIYVEEK